ncbi:type II toxin-antitoxin system VapB family antitoxin [Methylobacterium sp. J-026]|uniref:type II toxin-antitoxin system VapB family antitoxin n=1 Tax=Methylobacterium sp. J-026 TaxID=2836624 RepID=UPI001FB9404E|nr:type II toxin-antitoxin system VapB family antitoxin [Methylobacterium sp. J-026]MCJ2133185.1 type II toxin-antitoxin system VapB family antitoxin [Methylobacterium sp. J-026]
MPKLLTIRDEDFQRARNLASRLGTSLDEAVATALRDLDRNTSAEGGFDPGQQAELAAIRALVAEARPHIVPGALNDHGWLYDWNGLPA